MGNRVATTQWSQVLAARDGSDTQARRALEGLCHTYWSPLYAYSRSLGHDADEAQDLTQGFFTHMLEKDLLQGVEPSRGRFRSFLLISLKNYIAHQHRSRNTLKRGGGTTTIALDVGDVEETLIAPPIQSMTPEEVFEYRWGLTVLERALHRLRSEWDEQERRKLFDGLLPHLTGQDPRVPIRKVGAELGMTETAARGAMYRLRQRFGQLIRAEIGEIVAEEADIDAEARHLLAVIKPWQVSQS